MSTRHRPTVIAIALVVALTGGPVSRGAGQPPVNVCGGAPTGITVEVTGSTYRVAPPRAPEPGFFQTGQDASIVLSALDFDTSGGGLLFNHQSGIATDGTRLLMSDTFNNRVLIWLTPPGRDDPPDLVLGQTDFTSNVPGTGRDRFNWPVQVTTDGRHVAVADAYNGRILVWSDFPRQNAQPADVVIDGKALGSRGFRWPWGVWTDGSRFIVSGTGSSNVLIWNRIPTRDNVPPDLVLTGAGQLGTPRTIVSDGRSLAVGDHNARVPGKSESGTFFWRTLPTSNEAPPDFFMEDPAAPGSTWLHGTIDAAGRLIALGSTLFVWNAFPRDERDDPDLRIAAYDFRGGGHAGVALAGGRAYVSSGNSNKILVYNAVPTRSDQPPDFAIGSPGICTNTLDTNFFVTNPQPVSNGRNLFVASDFDNRLYVWRNLPDESGAHPDLVYRFPQFGPWGIGISGNTLALAGQQTVYVWEDELPLAGELPARIFRGGIGSVRFQELRGVAVDGRYFYVADSGANKVYVWVGIPSATSEPAFALDVASPRRLSSDGSWLTVTATFDHQVLVYPVSGLGPSTRPVAVGGHGTFNLPEGAFAGDGRLFVADTGFHRVHVWSDLQGALAGQRADIVLGETSFDDRVPEIGRNKLFWPGAVFFDGRYLWVGEFKFSNRVLRFGVGADRGR